MLIALDGGGQIEPGCCKHGIPVRTFPGHDCAYTDARDALILEAEVRAAKRIGEKSVLDGQESFDRRWNRYFHEAMNDLARERGIIGKKSA